jgi:predicted nuclease of predicted toxin-antitoxin system
VILLKVPLLADENVDARVVVELRLRGYDVASIRDRRHHGLDDASVLAVATAEGRVVLTHDSDFGTLAVHRGEPFVGIVYVRPGDLHPSEVLEVLDVVATSGVRVSHGFIVVVERRGGTTKVRLRERS